MTFTLSAIWAAMGPISKLVVLVLIIMSLASLYVAAERWFTFHRMTSQSRDFATVVEELLRDQRYADAIARAQEGAYQFSYLARLISMGLQEFETIRARPSRLDPADTIQRTLERAMYAEALGMREGLAILSTISSTAPYLGLFGALMGIARSFTSVIADTSVGTAPILMGVVDGLVLTALGVLTAVPAVASFNYLLDRIEKFEIQMNNSAAEIVDYCVKQLGFTRGMTNANG